MSESETIIQIGGAIKHCPLPSLKTCAIDDDEPQDKRCTHRAREKSAIGGFIGVGQLAWRALGPTVEILDPTTCSRQAAWTFGAILHNTSPVVTCICSIGVGETTHIVIGVDLGSEQNPQGMVGVLSLKRSRIIRAFHFRHKVTSVCMITGGEKVVDPCTLASELRPCQGLLAVGTAYASLYLIDLALDLGDEITSDEMSPALLTGICIPSTIPDFRRKEIIASHHHPMLCLSENINDGKTFRLLGPDDNILYETASWSVSISSLLYIPQLASLIVGYSFGSFQMMNLNLITIDCASPFEENSPPVFSFAYQEPENDPRSFVYLWVCRSPFSDNQKERNSSPLCKTSTCSMYAMSYDKKEWIEGHGLWYQGLQSVSPRFDFDATSSIGARVHDASPSRIVSATTVVGTSHSSSVTPLGLADIRHSMVASDEEAEPVPELSLALFCWEVTILDKGQIISQHFIAIFDINQWYQSQMPSRLRLNKEELCPYMSFHTLDRVPKSMDETLLAGAPSKGTWSRHTSRSHSEKEWYPSSLSYEFNLLTSEGLATYHCPSVQQNALSALVHQGPGAIVNPESVFNICAFSGIMSQLSTSADGIGSLTVSEREHLLNIALEYHLLSLLVQCVVEFSEGKFSHVGCSSQFLLEWAWHRLKDIKNSSDALCSPLFASSLEVCNTLSSQCLVSLHQNLTFLSHLATIITAIRDNAGEVTSLSAGELEGRVQVVNLIQLHLQATLWFYHCGLLPQCNPENAPDETSVPFPTEALHNLYRTRRNEIKGLGRSMAEGDLLLIDSIMEDCGDLLSEVWGRDDAGRPDATHYPPPSLHAILSMYLLPGIPTHTKHRIVQYLFLDLASLLSDNYSNVLEELVKYPSSFSLSPSLIKLTQAFWLIDNKDFQAGLYVLLDPLVNPSDVTPCQHRRIIKAFLYQGEAGNALAYTQIRRPPKHELEDIRMNLTLLLSNGRIREAFHHQRTYRVNTSAKELLWHFFNGCEQLGRLESVVHLPLSPLEEASFVSYLSASQHPSAQDILLVYYLQQSRYEKILSLHEAGLKINNASNMSHRSRHKTRAALMQGYISHLPDLQAQITEVGSSKMRPVRMIYSKPQPLSAHIRQSSSAFQTPKSRATTLRSSLNPMEDRKASFAPYTPFRSRTERRRATFRIGEPESTQAQEVEKNDMEFNKVVFPRRVNETEGDSRGLLTPPLFNAASKIATPISTGRLGRGLGETNLLQEDISKIMEDVLRESMRTSRLHFDNKNASTLKMELSSEVVSLLKTPPVHRALVPKHTPVDSVSGTPHSILKVRKILQQSQNSSDRETSPVSFPRHRLSAQANRNKSLDKSSLASDTSGFTPKQLRFDLPLSRRLSMDSTKEEDEEDFEEPSRRASIQLQQRKRKRSDSPPTQLGSSTNQPTPRKPLPGYRQNLSNEVGSSITIVEEIQTKFTHEAVKSPIVNAYSPKLDISSMNKYKNISEVKDSSRLRKSTSIPINKTPEIGSLTNKSISGDSSEVIEENSLKLSPVDVIISDTESCHDDSFHSVNEEYQSDDDNQEGSSHVEKELPDSNCIEDQRPSKQGTVSVTISHRQVVETSNHSTESVEKSYRFVYKNQSLEGGLKSTESFDNVSQNERIIESSPLLTEGDISKEPVSIKDSPKEVSLNNLERETNLSEKSQNSWEDETSEDVNSSYILRFSDSEEEEEIASQPGIANQVDTNKADDNSNETKAESDSSLPKSLSKQDTISLCTDIEQSLSKRDTIILGSSRLNSKEDSQFESVASVDTQIDSIHAGGNLPPDLLNVPPLHLTTKEKEIVDLMLNGKQSLSLKCFNNLSQQEDKKENLLDSSYVPILVFSDDEEEEVPEETCNALKKGIEEDQNMELEKLENGTEIRTKKEEKLEEDGETREKLDKQVKREEKIKEMEIEKMENIDAQTLKKGEELRTFKEIKTELKADKESNQKEESLMEDIHTERQDTKQSLVDHEENETDLNVPPLVNGPQENASTVDGYLTDDSDKTVEFDASHISDFVPCTNQTKEEEKHSSDDIPKDTPLKEQVETYQADQTKENVESSAVEITQVQSGEDKIQIEEPLLDENERENGPDNNNIRKEPSLLKTPPRKPIKPSEVLTPSRRSRRLSGLGAETEMVEGRPVTPLMPLRRSARNQSGSSSPLITPPKSTKRQRKASEGSLSDVSAVLTPPISEEDKKTSSVGKITKKDSDDKETDRPSATQESPLPLLQDPTAKVDVTPPQPSSERKKRTPKGPRTPVSQRKDTPRRRSARISGSADLLGTIVEDEGEPQPPLPLATTPIKTPRKSPPQEGARTPSKAVPAMTTRTRRRSSQSAAPDALLETIREDSEPADPVATATPTPATPSRLGRSRRRSVSVGDPSTDDKENAAAAARREAVREDPRPVARRTRRASLSSNVSESPPEKGLLKNLGDHDAKDYGTDASTNPSTHLSYTFISPDETSKNLIASRIPYLDSLEPMSVLFSNTKHSNLSGRKSLKSLPIPAGYEFTMSETPVTKRKPRRRKTSQLSSSVLVLNSVTKVDGDELRDDAVFEDENQPSALRHESSQHSEGIPNPQSPDTIYHLLEKSEEVPLQLPRKVSRPKGSKSSYRRGIRTLSFGNCNEDVDKVAEIEEKRPTKKARSSAKGSQRESENPNTHLIRLPNDEAHGFVFQKPEEILSTAEAVSDAFKRLTQEHEKIVSETFMFSPPLSLDHNRRKKRLYKRKSRK